MRTDAGHNRSFNKVERQVGGGVWDTKGIGVADSLSRSPELSCGFKQGVAALDHQWKRHKLLLLYNICQQRPSHLNLSRPCASRLVCVPGLFGVTLGLVALLRGGVARLLRRAQWEQEQR